MAHVRSSKLVSMLPSTQFSMRRGASHGMAAPPSEVGRAAHEATSGTDHAAGGRLRTSTHSEALCGWQAGTDLTGFHRG